ncbi:MAG: N-6 DNA methylase [Deltaproteobacteria bacterium]|nr:N-6 DNA methylase [Deltaproteobacteria bacterium]
MNKDNPRWSPTEQAFLQTARRLDEEKNFVDVEVLYTTAVLATLRKVLFQKLSLLDPSANKLPGPGDLQGIKTLWEYTQASACPLLGADLNPKKSINPKRVLTLVELPEHTADPGQVYQELQEVGLARKGKSKTNKKLSLTRGRSRRRRSGLFYTPDWMADRLGSLALGSLSAQLSAQIDDFDLHILDPACGSGRLLQACLKNILTGFRVESERKAQVVRQLVPRVFKGVDIDPIAVALAKTSFWLEADPSLGPFVGLEDVIHSGDAIGGPLRGGRPAKGVLRWEKVFGEELFENGNGFDVIVANPPFEVLKGFAKRRGLKQYVERIRKSGYDLALHGNLNTYRLFLERSLEVLKPGGRLAFVLPFSFMMDRTAAPLRAYMLRSGWVKRVEIYPESSKVFEEVGQSIVLLQATKQAHSPASVVIADGAAKSPDYRVSVDELASLDEQLVPIPVLAAGSFGLAAKLRKANSACLGDLAEGRVGEVDQTMYRHFMRSAPSKTLLMRGAHLSPFRAECGTSECQERWLDLPGFSQARGGGRWSQDVKSSRVVQTGIVNMEAGRRLVAAMVPKGVYLGNSLNYWAPRNRAELDQEHLKGYLLGLLNSTPLEWRFRLTSSNNNINLYEIRSLPLPKLIHSFQAERLDAFIKQSVDLIKQSNSSVLGTVRQITAGWGAPSRDDRAVAMLIAQVAYVREDEKVSSRSAWLDAVIDHLVNWHLGMDEPDLERMLKDVPARSLEETR